MKRLEDQLIYIGKVSSIGKGELKLNMDMHALLNKKLILKSKDIYSLYSVKAIGKGLILSNSSLNDYSNDFNQVNGNDLNGSEAYLARKDMELLEKMLPIEIVGMKVIFEKQIIGEVVGISKSKFYDILCIRNSQKEDNRDREKYVEYNIPNTEIFIKNINRKKREIELKIFEESF